jgi:AbiJ N-terminal domain 4
LSFSQREGFKHVKTAIQLGSMDSELRNGLWNGLAIHYWSLVVKTFPGFDFNVPPNMESFIENVWINYFKKPLDTLDNITSDWHRMLGEIREYFFKCQWYDVYDFLEFTANNYPDVAQNKRFIKFCNSILQREVSAYRFVGGRITQLTSEEEIAEIEQALSMPSPLRLIKLHLETALKLLSNKTSPDYRNSIKESISAVEAVCRLVLGKPKATLGDALKELEKNASLQIHGALKNAFSNLYGYTSDASGIRHSLLDESDLDFEDAKFMLVSCSAFVNYLLAKASKAGIRF